MASIKLSNIRFISKIEMFLGVLACLSFLLILTPQSWINRTLKFDPLAFVSFMSDDSSSGGNSKVSWVREEEQMWKCEVGNISPIYCGLIIDVRGENGKGLDLSKFQEMTVWLDYEGAANSIRFYLRNAGDPYYNGRSLSTKYNQIVIPVENLSEGFTVVMEGFKVANWWLAASKVPLKYSHAEFSNVIYVEVQTGEGAITGEHKFRLKKIVWKGNFVSNEAIFRTLILGWSALILLLLAFRLVKLKFRLARDKRKKEELAEINKLLDLQNKELVDLARTDQLTGLINRIGIRDALFENLKSWQDKRTPFSLILIDVDHFKKVNDHYGHAVGDEVLIAIAALLRGNTRRSDCPARWGGEEFLLLCQDCDLYRAQMVAEILRRKLEDAEIHPDLKVTASFGVASMTKPDPDDLFKRADQALYEAKTQGRNRVCVNAGIDE
ncbi:GGDEF domain-containing protein [Teredinibacter franksiae]|uniref:GGDEF domain-containing protein n=1 Tax=Teredinibacter franksiae TaxID=2761453 RepID=UPI00162534EC|nr:GGDEF domain-containing protein [Teredinibacter franksiae]